MRRLCILLVFMLFFVVGCKETTQSENTIVKKSDVTMHHYFSGSLSGGIDDMVNVFNTEQDTYKLRAIPLDHEAFKESILVSLDKNNPPEIFSYWAGAKTRAILDELVPLTDIWESEGLDARFNGSVRDVVFYNETPYMLPITQHYVTFYYNKSVFDTYGINPPTTYEELITACDTLMMNDIKPFALGAKNKWPVQFWFDYLLLRTAGLEFREALMNGSETYTSPQVLRVFDLMENLLTKGYFGTGMENYDWYERPMEELVSGDSAMMLMGTWMISTLNQFHPDFIQSIDYDYFTFPLVDEQIPKISLGPVDGLIIAQNGQNLDGAKEVVKYLSSNVALEKMSGGSGAFTPLRESDVALYSAMQLNMLKDFKSEEGWALNYDLATPPEIAEIGLELLLEFFVFPDAGDFLIREAELEIGETWRTLGVDYDH